MKLIVGLGNPGRRYASTRHNVGWWLLDRLAARWSFDNWRSDFQSLVSGRRFDDDLVLMVKPQTYMNLSGGALTPYLDRAGFDVKDDLLIVTDDVALPIGSFRLRAQGSAGGHNGLKSIEHALGSQGYARMRIGVRPLSHAPASEDLSNFVLSGLQKNERELLEELEPDLEGAVKTWLTEGVASAMNRYNRRQPPPETTDQTE